MQSPSKGCRIGVGRMCNPNSRKAGSLQPLASAKRKRTKSPLQSALRAAVNRGGVALQPRLLFLQPNRRRSQPIWRGSSVRAGLAQNRPNFAPRPFAGLLPPPFRQSRCTGRHNDSQGGKGRREFPAACLNEILFYRERVGLGSSGASDNFSFNRKSIPSIQF